MKSGSSLHDVIDRVDREAELTRDYITPARHLRLVERGAGDVDLVLDDGSGSLPFAPTELAHQHLADATGIPLPYYRRLRSEAPELLASNANTWLSRLSERRLIRTLQVPDGPVVRAILSDRYRALSHRALLEAVLPVLHQQGARIESCELTDRHVYIKAVTSRVEGEVRVGEAVQAGVMISNSEVGVGALVVQPLIFTLRCSNGAIIEDASLRRHHVGRRQGEHQDATEHLLSTQTRIAEDHAFFLRVRDITQGALDEGLFQQHLFQLQDAARRPMPEHHDEKIVEVLSKRSGFSAHEGISILAHLRAGKDFTQWGLSSAVTRTSQDIHDFERATELERIGGRLSSWKDSAWASLMSIN